ncbi:hypothetical protein GQ464_004485 [Rhodocaloribacter litoris]|uniref:hypothetical protein n=1 Tax=Rhodocaloribacter litoris TaxID=2558931 RepID=UPI00141DE1FB|nr:hypothetical protein [Rhodocaloribacter litoris]QXD16217.1 hypothetical protein GQ464_004485 [Rhodocaloribacter litoris]GIV60707.1 MAG: hypothetical protein KatS3mg043_1796 [Rhodothermaceae bacterium]
MRILCILSLLLVTGLATLPAQGQAFGRHNSITATGTSYHVFTQPGDATIQVLVVGSASTGIYEVSDGTDLGRLLALTGFSMAPGGPGQSVKYRIKLFRETGGGRREVLYDEPIEQMLAHPGAYPVLQEGDIVMVESRVRQGFQWRDALTILTSIGTVALLVERLRNL